MALAKINRTLDSGGVRKGLLQPACPSRGRPRKISAPPQVSQYNSCSAKSCCRFDQGLFRAMNTVASAYAVEPQSDPPPVRVVEPFYRPWRPNDTADDMGREAYRKGRTSRCPRAGFQVTSLHPSRRRGYASRTYTSPRSKRPSRAHVRHTGDARMLPPFRARARREASAQSGPIPSCRSRLPRPRRVFPSASVGISADRRGLTVSTCLLVTARGAH